MSILNRDNNETPNVSESKDEVTYDDKLSDVMDMDADIFMDEAIVKLRGLPLATKRRKSKDLAAEAKLFETQSQMNNDRYNAKKWGQIAWQLRTLK